MGTNTFDLTALPPKARVALYYVTTVTGLAIGGFQVGFSAAEAGQPTWLTVALAVYAFLGTATGLTAASNTVTGKAVRAETVAAQVTPEGSVVAGKGAQDVSRATEGDIVAVVPIDKSDRLWED